MFLFPCNILLCSKQPNRWALIIQDGRFMTTNKVLQRFLLVLCTYVHYYRFIKNIYYSNKM